jgi:hypothetical protein
MKNYGYSDKQEIEFVKPLEVIVKDYRGREIEADYSIEEERRRRGINVKLFTKKKC